MNRTTILSITVLFFSSSLLASAASAGEATVRQARQRARIHNGVESGSLVPREARLLRHEQRHIRKSRRRMLGNDGKIGPAERARLHRKQDRASRHIFRAKHNGRAR